MFYGTRLFRGIERKLHAKGYGIHSPFAFAFITGVIYADDTYYAFSDIPSVLERNALEEALTVNENNRLSFRVVRFFKPRSVLEIHSGYGVNSLFITAPDSRIHCVSVEESPEKRAVANQLQKEWGRSITTETALSSLKEEPYDLIFLDVGRGALPPLDALFRFSHGKTVWVIHGITGKTAKLFWKNIVNHEKVTVTFDRKQTGIAVLDPSYHKSNYFI